MKVFGRFLACYFRQNAYYRFEFVMQFVRDALMMYCYYALWNIIFDYGMGYEGAEKIQVLVYGVYGAVVTTFVTRDGCQVYMKTRIRQGTMDADLLKPLGFQMHMLMRDLSQKAAKFVYFTLPALILFSLLTRLFFVPALTNFCLFLVSTVLAYMVLFSINFLFGILCFYTLSVENIAFCYTAVITFLSGQMVPLWIFPQWAQNIVNILPFRCIFDMPMSIYIGRLTVAEALKVIALQLVWGVVLWLLGGLAWRGVRKHVISQGG
jgi:ABC-2 type transport system permease protein